MKENTIPANTEQKVPDTREESRTMVPPVDIFETENGLVVVADLPGVEQGQVEVDVDKNVLTLKAKPAQKLTEGLSLNEFRLLPYFRQFQLSDTVDQENIRAEMKYGVLTIHLPKVAEKQPRKIAVTVTG
ncbi:MAG: Hsp20/alpha crystallin family protein [Candidatus Hydrogenedens sp.]|nr:Hsp20/alpha crystallin family protein [Candidatus Hydrogenedentota bacterium]NLF56205.1 Hsp20/alpha crystallin family protein [Candidatus Hydrogenedens sp.]